jgi:hypothetical protein
MRVREFAAFARMALQPGLMLVSLTASVAWAGNPPTLPLTFDTSYVAPSSQVINVPAGGNFQTALNNAQLGDTIVLEAGATYTGPFTLPNKISGSGWIYIQSSAHANLPPPGKRVTLADATRMPRVVVAAGGGSAVDTANNAHHYRFVGIHFRPVSGNFVYQLVTVGNGDTSVNTLPSHIVFDRCIFEGDSTVGGRRGIAMDGRYVAVIDSHLSGFKEVGADTQAAWAHNTSGPLKLVNNYLEAAGENVMFGGADSKSSALVPADIEITRNHFFKPLAWIGSSWVVKNLLEFKAAERVLVRGNVLENNWAAAQSGFSVLLTPRNQNGTAAWSVVRDITIESNRFLNMGSGFNIVGTDDLYQSLRTERVVIRNNYIEVSGLNGAEGRIFQVLSNPVDLTIDHNTALGTGRQAAFGMTESSSLISRFVFTNNLVTNGTYGFIGTDTGDGLSTLNRYYAQDRVFSKNAIISGNSGAYPSGNFFPINADAVRFSDYRSGDYRLSVDSPYRNAGTDGKDLGADFNVIAQALGGATEVKVPRPPSSVVAD